MNQYVCAFRGRRDSYQVPLALAEQGSLDQLITDFYTPDWMRSLATHLPAKWQSKLLSRWDAGIPAQRVKSLLPATFLEHSRHRLGYSPAATYAELDQYFSRSAAKQAKATKSHLLLYAPYAWEAFVAHYLHDPQRVLFQFHPHPKVERQILSEDIARFPYMQQSYQEETRQHLPNTLQNRESNSWKYADLILCTSRFTRDTLISAGALPEKCRVIPYGVNLPEYEPFEPHSAFRVLFVGSGIQRKGLHHLLLAWQQARLPTDSKLTLVCRVLDPGTEPLILQIPNLELIRGCDRSHLDQLYRTSSLLAMPSLVEGFGQVYLEALSFGCPVLGTENTCLPDLGGESNGIFWVEPANIDQLSAKLEFLATRLPGNLPMRLAARSCASRFPWTKFRSDLSSVLQDS